GIEINQTSGDIFVIDNSNSRFEQFSSTGAFIRSFGSSGIEAGQFSNPNDISLNAASGKVYVTDTGNSRVQIFSLLSGIWGPLSHVYQSSSTTNSPLSIVPTL